MALQQRQAARRQQVSLVPRLSNLHTTSRTSSLPLASLHIPGFIVMPPTLSTIILGPNTPCPHGWLSVFSFPFCSIYITCVVGRDTPLGRTLMLPLFLCTINGICTVVCFLSVFFPLDYGLSSSVFIAYGENRLK